MTGDPNDLRDRLLWLHHQACGADNCHPNATIYGEAYLELWRLIGKFENERITTMVVLDMYANVVEKLKKLGLTDNEIHG